MDMGTSKSRREIKLGKNQSFLHFPLYQKSKTIWFFTKKFRRMQNIFSHQKRSFSIYRMNPSVRPHRIVPFCFSAIIKQIIFLLWYQKWYFVIFYLHPLYIRQCSFVHLIFRASPFECCHSQLQREGDHKISGFKRSLLQDLINNCLWIGR